MRARWRTSEADGRDGGFSGETYGFMVSGLARTGERNVLERTPVVMVRWP